MGLYTLCSGNFSLVPNKQFYRLIIACYLQTHISVVITFLKAIHLISLYKQKIMVSSDKHIALYTLIHLQIHFPFDGMNRCIFLVCLVESFQHMACFVVYYVNDYVRKNSFFCFKLAQTRFDIFISSNCLLVHFEALTTIEC